MSTVTATSGTSTTSGSVVGVDVGGTKVLAAVVDEDGTVLARARADTPPRDAPPRRTEDVVVDVVARVLDGAQPAAVGLAVAGFVDAAGAVVRFAPHVSWRDEPLRDRLVARWGVPVHLDNDANAALWAEHRHGVARGADDVALVALGTGIGGALLLGGRPHRGAGGMAGELGHVTLVPGGRACPCGLQGCWEEYASGRALERFFTEAAGEVVPGPQVTAYALAGDPVAREALRRVGSHLGAGLAGVVAALDPGLVVIGGGVAQAGELLLAPARAVLAERVPGAAHRDLPRVVAGSLGVDAGCVGAADRARALLTR